MDKQDLRRSAKAVRMNLTAKEVEEKSKNIAKNLKTITEWPKAKSIHSYVSNDMMNEPQTTPIFSMLWRRPTATTYVPRLIGRDMEIVKVEKDTHFAPNMRGIPEPDCDDVMTPKKIDIILVPLLVFDKQLNRLGYGGGYYDRFLKHYPDAIKIGIAFDEDKVEVIPTEDHDVQLDFVVTDQAVYSRH
ncbi:TPA: 5-formyltetrahydrofolate cyclo-ligase [Candidatus Saccharibacteria bacterium]|nr:5-formyltetrahydrofolate cyclo-ligase [Candidatus Saccharibacteria bacterium]HIO87882.1 5-formyltetrahydrofolate cyclo-ligase [Candidatus Saccharibacteria bacterium]